jgi:hypothetical protein
MTWFSKPKHGPPVTPELCARCGKRPGSTLMHVTPAPAAASLPATGEFWLCDACVEAVRREAGRN